MDPTAEHVQLLEVVVCALDRSVQLCGAMLMAEIATEHEKPACAESLAVSVELIGGLEMIDDPTHACGVSRKARVVLRVARGHMVEQSRADLLGLVQHRRESAGDDHAAEMFGEHTTDTSASRSRRSSVRRGTSRRRRRTASSAGDRHRARSSPAGSCAGNQPARPGRRTAATRASSGVLSPVPR